MAMKGSLCCAVALLCSLTATAQDSAPYWRQRALVGGLTETRVFDPTRVLRDGDGYALIDRDRRVYTDANLTPLRQARNHHPVQTSTGVALMPGDAMMLLHNPPDPYCSMSVGNALGVQNWSASTAEAGCQIASLDRNGTMYTVDTLGAVAHVADGRRVQLAALVDPIFPDHWTHAAQDGGAYVYFDNDQAPGQIRAYGPTLDLRWQRDIEELAGRFYHARWASAPGHLVLAAGDWQGTRLFRIDPATGNATPVATGEVHVSESVVAMSVDEAGRITLYTGGDGQHHLYQFAGDSTMRTLRSSSADPCGYFFSSLYDCALTSIGEHTYWIEHDDAGHARLFRVTGNGEPQVIWQSEKPVGSIAFGADGSIVAITADANERAGNFDSATNRQIVRIGPDPTDGITTHSPMTIVGDIESSSERYVHLPGGDVLELSQYASTFVASTDTYRNEWSIRRIGLDGHIAWQKPMIVDGYLFDFASSNTQICARASGTRSQPDTTGGRLQCLSTTDGGTTLYRDVPDAILPYQPLLVTDTPGKVYLQVRANAAGSSPERARLLLLEGATGTRDIATIDLGAAIEVAPDGGLVIASGSAGAMVLLQVDSFGKATAPVAFPASISTVHSLAFGEDGTVWMTFAYNDAMGPRVGRIDRQARFIDAQQPTVFAVRIGQALSTAHGTALRLETPYIDFSGTAQSTGIVMIGNDGGKRWQYLVGPDAWSVSAIAQDERVQLFGWRGSVPFLHDLATASGALTNQLDLPLPVVGQDDGSAHFPSLSHAAFNRVLTVHRKPGRVVLGETGIAPLVQADSVAPALAGAWQLGDLSGKGLVLAYHAANRTLSGAWFTHDSPGGGVDHAALRWNTLAGTVTPSSTSVAMTIHENRGGAFDAGPVTASTTVGQATLTAIDCDTAFLRYQFADGRVPARTVALTRASPRTVACAASPAAYVPRSDLAGAWYEPETSGQGLHIAVYPAPGHAADQPETLGLGWFTYDPAGLPDESTQQHWFTASGRFVDLSQSSATLTIYRTTGGNRDTRSTYNTHAVGSATLTRIDCDSATLSYQFADNALAAGYAGRHGSIALSRLGGCAAP